MDKIQFIISEFKKAEIEIDADMAGKFLSYYEYLVEYNEKVNLTAITEFSEVVTKHFVDSVLPFTKAKIEGNESFIDVGTGAGFPSIPLMIVYKNLKGTLLDSLEKRCVFLRECVKMLGLSATVVHARAEDYAKEKRESFDFATARAVAALPVLSEYCMPYVKKNGRFIALKSVNEDVSLAENAIKILGGKLETALDYEITNGDSRRLIVIRKISQTPTKYPRNSGAIKKKSL